MFYQALCHLSLLVVSNVRLLLKEGIGTADLSLALLVVSNVTLCYQKKKAEMLIQKQVRVDKMFWK
jgi:hypothetical protein